jgi:Ca2+-binding EF-hand superfamily protein
MRISEEQFEKFREIWSEYDINGVGYINTEHLDEFIMKIASLKLVFLTFHEILEKD